MKTFLKGFCIGLLCLSLLGLAWFLQKEVMAQNT